MTSEPLKSDEAEFVEAVPVERPLTGRPFNYPSGAVVYQSQGLPCCSGCGCLLITLVVLSVANIGPLFSGILALLTAAVLSTAALRLAGVNRLSPSYAYAMTPVFLASLNLAARFIRGQYLFSIFELIAATLLIYAFLYAARGLGRR